MEQYIPKSVVLAEIERKKEEEVNYDDESKSFASYADHVYYLALDSMQDFINTLEVKEVDLDKAIDDYIYTHDGRKRLALELDWKYCNLTLKGGNEIIKFAKHFFELGIQIGNKAQKGE